MLSRAAETGTPLQKKNSIYIYFIGSGKKKKESPFSFFLNRTTNARRCTVLCSVCIPIPSALVSLILDHFAYFCATLPLTVLAFPARNIHVIIERSNNCSTALRFHKLSFFACVFVCTSACSVLTYELVMSACVCVWVCVFRSLEQDQGSSYGAQAG